MLNHHSDTIRRYVGDTSFARGEGYFADNMVVNGRRVGDTLKADCHGSRGTPYRVSATVSDGQIVEAECSCPVGSHCKHIAALLLTWLDRPDEFVKAEDTSASLAQRSQAELVALVEQMLERYPELESLLDLPLPTGEPHKPANPKVYQKQAAAAFNRTDRDSRYDDYAAVHDIARELDAMLGTADKFRQQGDPFNAAAIYQAISGEVLEHYNEFHDESGKLGGVVYACVTGLGDCLAHIGDDAQWRENILRALFAVYRFDIELGGSGLSDSVPDLILQHATPDERKAVVEWAHDAMQSGRGSEWSRRAYGHLLLELQEDEMDDEAYLQVCRESRRLNDLVGKLLELGRVDEAANETGQASDYEMLLIADIFVAHKQGELAERLMAKRLPKTQDARLKGWLKQRLAAGGDTAGALALARQLFTEYASLEQYQEIRALAQKLNLWPTLRAELIAGLERKSNWHMLTAIYLDERELDAALQSVKRIPHTSYGYYGVVGDLRLMVADAAAESHPHEALRIYAELAEQAIGQRNRDSYRSACEYLVRVRDLYMTLGEERVWQQYRAQLQEQYKTLRALKEEMANAKL